jgi:tetratricopeptide (TPR) repeat protein
VVPALLGFGVYVYVQGQRARRHLEEAERALERRNFSQAGQHLDQYLQIRPRSAAYQFLAARTFRRADAYDQAEEHLNRAQQLGWDPEAVELERLLSRAQQGDMTDAVEKDLHGRTRRESDRSDAPLILEALTKAYLQTSKSALASDCLSRWRELEPENIQMVIWRGWLLRKQGDPFAALDHFERAVQLDPENDEARMHLADLLLITLEPRKASEHFERLREQLPGQPAVLLGLANCRTELVQPAEAEQLLDELLNDARFAEILGPSLHGQRRLPETLSAETRTWVRQAVHLAPYNLRVPSYLPYLYAAALTARAKIALQEGDLGRAEAWLRQAVVLNPADRDANLKLWQCLERRGLREEAQTYEARCKALNEKHQQTEQMLRQVQVSDRDPDLRCQLGETLLELGRDPEALRWFESALRKDPRHGRTRKALQAYYDRSGDLMAAGILRNFPATR